MALRQDKNIEFKKGYKYQVTKDYYHILPFDPQIDRVIETDYMRLEPNRQMITKKGYCSDGPSGPTVDSLNFMRATIGFHDPWYQLLRLEELKPIMRAAGDYEMYRLLRQDEMSYLRARVAYRGVRIGAGPAADPSRLKRVIVAPGI